MAETGHRTLEPRDPVPSAASQIASNSLTQYLDRSVAIAQERLHEGDQVENDLPNIRSTVRARGRKGGRSKKLKTAAKVAEARRMYADTSRSIAEICSALGISRASLYRYLKDAQE